MVICRVYKGNERQNIHTKYAGEMGPAVLSSFNGHETNQNVNLRTG